MINAMQTRKKETRKFSSVMAMIMGVLVTLEIMVMGAMLLNIDFHSADRIALVLAFMVLYSGVVAALTDK
nr:hypothetical protein [uncultured Blautia sp.]